jgi:hypothetical protein
MAVFRTSFTDVQTQNIAALSALTGTSAPDTGLEWQHANEAA